MNWRITVLQTAALPLGYAAKKSGLLPEKETHYRRNDPKRAAGKSILERETGVEPATSTLAR